MPPLGLGPLSNMDFNRRMINNYIHSMYCVGWDYLYIPKPQRLNRLSLEMDTQFHRVLYRACDYLSTLGSNLIHVSRKALEEQAGFFCESCMLLLASAWWRHQMGTFSALLAICAGNSPVPGEFPTQRPVTRSFEIFFDLRLNKWLSKQWWGWWFETLSRPLWRHRNGMLVCLIILVPYLS